MVENKAKGNDMEWRCKRNGKKKAEKTLKCDSYLELSRSLQTRAIEFHSIDLTLGKIKKIKVKSMVVS